MRVIIAAWLLMLCPLPASAEELGRGIALIIGNSDYSAGATAPGAKAEKLEKTDNDARLVAYAFGQLGFAIYNPGSQAQLSPLNGPIVNVHAADFERIISNFSDLSRGYETSVIYYAGHGQRRDNTQYLIAADANFATRSGFVPLSQLVNASKSDGNRIVILDSCRKDYDENGRAIKVSDRTNALTTRSSDGADVLDDRVLKSYVILAAAKGKYAWAGGSITRNTSPFSYYLAQGVLESRSELYRVYTYVRDNVYAETANLNVEDRPQMPTLLQGPEQSKIYYFNPSEESRKPKLDRISFTGSFAIPGDDSPKAAELPVLASQKETPSSTPKSQASLSEAAVIPDRIVDRAGREDSLKILNEYIGTSPTNTIHALKERAKAGDGLAAYFVAIAYDNGQFVDLNPDEFSNWAERSDKLGTPLGTYLLGYAAYSGRGRDRKVSLAVAETYFQRASQLGVPKADYMLYRIYAAVEPAKDPASAFKDEAKAQTYLRKAAANEVWDGMNALGTQLLKDHSGVTAVPAEGIKLLKMAWEKGDVNSGVALCQYEFAQLQPKAWGKGGYCEGAANRGSKYAMFLVGWGYLYGTGGAPRRDYDLAFNSFLAAVEVDAGCRMSTDLCRYPPIYKAYCELAVIYTQGLGRSRDVGKATAMRALATANGENCSKT